MAGWPVDLCALFLVAHKTYFRLRDPVADFVMIGMDLMTSGTRDVAVRMRTPRPVYSLPALMTGLAGLIPVCDGISRVLSKRAIGCFFRPVDMGITLAVAAGTSRCTTVSDRSMLCFANSEHRIIAALVMAACACLIAFKNDILIFFVVNTACIYLYVRYDHKHKKQHRYPGK